MNNHSVEQEAQEKAQENSLPSDSGSGNGDEEKELEENLLWATNAANKKRREPDHKLHHQEETLKVMQQLKDSL